MALASSILRNSQDITTMAGAIIYTGNAAPPSAELAAGQMALWLDATNGAGKLMVKAKTADGTVVTGSVTLS